MLEILQKVNVEIEMRFKLKGKRMNEVTSCRK